MGRKGSGKYSKADLVQIIVKKKVDDKASPHTLLTFLMNEMGFKMAYAYEIMRMANDYIKAIWEKNVTDAMADAMADLLSQEEDAKRRKDNRLALEIRKEINKIQGLYTNKLDITSDGQPIQINLNWNKGEN